MPNVFLFMGKKNKINDLTVLALSILLFCQKVQGQDSLRFSYHGEDAKIAELTRQNMHFGGVAYGFYADEEIIAVPYLLTLQYEFGTRLLELGKTAGVSLNFNPHVAITHFFIGRISGTANINLFNYATESSNHKLGLTGGIGYEYFGTSSGVNDLYPILRGGFLFDNFRLIYQNGIATDFEPGKHLVSIGAKIDF